MFVSVFEDVLVEGGSQFSYWKHLITFLHQWNTAHQTFADIVDSVCQAGSTEIQSSLILPCLVWDVQPNVTFQLIPLCILVAAVLLIPS